MPSKYDAILPLIQPAPVADRSYQNKVEKVKAEVTWTQPVMLAKEFVRLRKAKDDLDAHAYEINLHIEAITQLLIESQDAGAEGWGDYGAADNALRLANGDTVRVQVDISGQVTDKEAYRLWCIANGYELKMQLWPTTTNAIVKERLMAGEPEPNGVEARKRSKLVFVEAKA